jgi:RHS repeat-associated protein
VVGEQVFVYCGWNLSAEFDAGSAKAIGSTTGPRRTYTWGLDLSGSIQGAGGVGGLLAIEEHGGYYAGLHFPAYDGNGNVVAILDDTDGDDEAWYDSDGFGQDFTKSTTRYTTENPFQFSTKYLDRESGLYYYGYRHYDPETGRWVSRDSIGERGGLNLQSFVENDVVNHWDFSGNQKQGRQEDTPSDNDPVPPMPTVESILIDLLCGWEKWKKRNTNEICYSVCEKCNPETGEVIRRKFWYKFGTFTSCMAPLCPKGWTKVAEMHTHPLYDIVPSQLDRDGVEEDVPHYVVSGYRESCPHIIRVLKYGSTQRDDGPMRYYDCKKKEWIDEPNHADDDCDGQNDN